MICVEKIAGVEGLHPLDVTKIPGCTYCSPQVASVGLTEAAAKEQGHKVKVGRFPFIGNGKAIALGEPEGMVKTVFDAETGELLGAHMIGAEVTELIQGYVIAAPGRDHRARPDAHHLPAPDAFGNDARVGARRLWARHPFLSHAILTSPHPWRAGLSCRRNALYALRHDCSASASRPPTAKPDGHRHPRPQDHPQARLDPGQGAELGGLPRDPQADARQAPAHGLRGGGLPEYRRVLDPEARDRDDPRRHLHPRLRLLQRQDRPAQGRRSAWSPRTSPRWWRPWASRHVVITSVDRDDLPDGGASQFVRCIEAIRKASPATTIEILTPDFLRKPGGVEKIVEARPDVYNHNLETVPRLYRTVRPGARYFHSLRLLQQVKELDPPIFTKSGIMVGLGEEKREILQVMDDMRSAEVDFLTIGQYLQPTPRHHAVVRFVDARGVRGHRALGARQGLPAGLGDTADPLVLSCRRRFRPAARRAQRRPCRRLNYCHLCRTMPTHAEQRHLPYTPEQLFDLVSRVERYPEFLPWCKAAADHQARRRRLLGRPGHRLQGVPRALQLEGDADPERGRRCRVHQRPVPLPQQPLALPAGRGRRLHRRLLRRFRVPLAHAAKPDRHALQRGRATHGRRLRDPRRSSSTAPAAPSTCPQAPPSPRPARAAAACYSARCGAKCRPPHKARQPSRRS